jgi:hypothetical protein
MDAFSALAALVQPATLERMAAIPAMIRSVPGAKPHELASSQTAALDPA